MKSEVETVKNKGGKSNKTKSKVKNGKCVKTGQNIIKPLPHKTPHKPSKELKSASIRYSNVKHKQCTGADNWKKFLESQGMSLKLNNNVNNNNNNKNKRNSKNLNRQPDKKSNKITKVVGMDCEMVGIGDNGLENMLARVSLVNNFGDCIYDKYVKPREKVIDYRTHISGIRPEDIQNAEEFEVVQKEVADILKSRILVGHAIKNDLDVLFLSHPKHCIRDTARFFCKKRTPSLKHLAAEYLNTTIQEGEHSSIQDAQAAMQLYNMFRKQWESGRGNKYKRRIINCEIENKAVAQQDLEAI